MKQVRIYQRKNRPGWYVGWYENGKEKCRAMRNKKLAEHFRSIVYYRLNTEGFFSRIDMTWSQLVFEYLRTFDVRHLTTAAKYEAGLTLRHFEALCGPVSSKYLWQEVIDSFIVERGKGVSKWTLNKDINNIRAFISWATEKRYVSKGLKAVKVKTTQRQPKPLNSTQIRDLLIAARHRSDCWYLRVLLAITTGLRSGDIDRLTVSDIDFEQGTLQTHSQKTRKGMVSRPLPPPVMPVLVEYVNNLPDGQVLLMTETNTHKKWKKIRSRAGLSDLRFHDLRVTFASTLQQQGASLSVAQRLLEHADPQTTARIYTGVDEVLAREVNKLPVDSWLV